MVEKHERKLVIVGIYVMALGAFLGLVSVLLRAKSQNGGSWDEEVMSAEYVIAYYLLIYAYMIPIFGFWAIHKLVSSQKKMYLLSFWALLFTILGSALPLSSLGISAFVYPALARTRIAMEIGSIISEGKFITPGVRIFLLCSGLYYMTGIVLFFIALRKTKDILLTWAGISLLIHGILIIMPENWIINVCSWILLFLCTPLLLAYEKRSLPGTKGLDTLAPSSSR